MVGGTMFCGAVWGHMWNVLAVAWLFVKDVGKG